MEQINGLEINLYVCFQKRKKIENSKSKTLITFYNLKKKGQSSVDIARDNKLTEALQALMSVVS